ncbi:MAG TPA: lipoprotein insertase outer membrane protein LolB [Gammaproteobacteria bacterium]|nr:lipoprotein insertase outer membrane protein LolB [Gammaproteobacteria bacterium]
MNKLFWIIIFSVFLVTSCATTSTFQPHNPKTSQHWRVQGKIAMQDQGRAETASLDWQQNVQNYQIRIFGPLGIGAVEINGNPQGVELIDSKGQIHQAASAELLSQQILGYPLPIADLVYWLKGVKTKHHHGWTVHYLSYHQNGMPKLMTATHQGINLRIFIDKWQFF